MRGKIAQALEHDAWGGVDKDSLERGIGGREGALIRLSREWARAGYEVTNFVPTRTPERIYEGDGFYEFVPFSMAPVMLATFPYDACVAWECPSVFADPRIVERNPIRLISMQCADLPHGEPEAAAEFATGIVCLSDWHVGYMASHGFEGPFYVLPNCVDLEHYPWRERKGLPRNMRFFYSSSPDRGLWHLLKLWPHIRRLWPDSTLSVGYGVGRYLAREIWSHRRQGEMAVEIANLMRYEGVTDLGKVSQRELAKIQRNSTMLAYPCDTIQPTETGCITVIEAMAAGCPVVTTNCDCLEDEFGSVAAIVPLPFEANEYLETIATVHQDKQLYTTMANNGRAFAETRQWKDIAPRWLALFEELQCGSR